MENYVKTHFDKFGLTVWTFTAETDEITAKVGDLFVSLGGFPNYWFVEHPEELRDNVASVFSIGDIPFMSEPVSNIVPADWEGTHGTVKGIRTYNDYIPSLGLYTFSFGNDYWNHKSRIRALGFVQITKCPVKWDDGLSFTIGTYGLEISGMQFFGGVIFSIDEDVWVFPGSYRNFLMLIAEVIDEHELMETNYPDDGESSMVKLENVCRKVVV